MSLRGTLLGISAVLALVILIRAFVPSFGPSPPEFATTPSNTSETPEPSVAGESPHPSQVAPARKPAETALRHESAPASLTFNRKPNPLPDLDQRLAFELGETEIHRIEQSLVRLPRQAYTKARENGWELHLVDDDSIFVSLGFRDGDLITYRSLEAEGVHPQLSARLVSVFEGLER